MTDTRHALAERDTSKPAEKQGLFDKFKVLRRDGSSEPGEKHDGREYFVLDIDHDPHAKAALAAYADDVEATHPYLAKDMRARYALSAQPVAGAVAQPVAWRCFHCDETFTDTAAAQEHFGPSEHDKPACQMDIGYVRWLLEQHRRNVDDDSDALRTVRSLAGEHETLRRRAEEQGYARGLADAKKHPEELGLIATPQAAPAPAPEPSAQAVAHPSHQTVREWMPVSEALRLSDLWTAGDLDNCGQWRAAIKVLADEVRALAASPQPEPSAQGEPVAWRPGDPIYDDAYVRGVAVGFAEDDSRRTTLLRIADRIEARASAPSTPPPAVVEAVPQAWPIERAADMLTAYAELVKATGRYAEEHYIPEIENVAAELRGIAPKAAQPVKGER